MTSEKWQEVVRQAIEEYKGLQAKEKARIEKMIGSEVKERETDWVKVEQGNDTTRTQQDKVQVFLSIVTPKTALQQKKQGITVYRYNGSYCIQCTVNHHHIRTTMSWDQYQNMEEVSHRELKLMANYDNRKPKKLPKKYEYWVRYCNQRGVFITLAEYLFITDRNSKAREQARQSIIDNNNRKYPIFNQSLFKAYCYKGDPLLFQLNSL